jgi:ABC-2 type transport system permease protein
MNRLKALIKKEFLQIIRDPSSILIAFVLPLILLFIYGYGINLDNNKLKIGLVLEDSNPDITSLEKAFMNSRFLDVKIGHDRREFEGELVSGKLRGLVIIPQNFTHDLAFSRDNAKIQVITDGAEPNIAYFAQSYVNAVVQTWLHYKGEDSGNLQADPLIQLEPQFWYNTELKSRNSLVPGSIAIIMSLIGTLLTALVISREWERGTMEAMMSTPVSIIEVMLGKLIPYFVLGIFSMAICTAVAILIYKVPLRGSFIWLFVTTSVFLFCALGQGLLISSVAKDQFVASQIAFMSSFLPAFMLSGFIFEISSMPVPIQILTYLLPPRYFVTCLQTIFLTGNVWPLFLKCIGYMMIIGSIFFLIILRKIKKRLD